ncbi:MAG: DUF748 domain-containing protein [Candidatus Deferrimicrobiaceae bacterium]
MKTTSKVLIAMGIVAVIVAGGVFFLYPNYDRIVAAAIEKYGSEATGTKVAVSSVRIKRNAGEGSIRNLSIGNPLGFSTPSSVHLETITVAVDTGSVTKNRLVIDRVMISAPRITYEINESGQTNIEAIRSKVEMAEDEAEHEGSSRNRRKIKDGGNTRIIMKSLIIENGEVTIQAATLPGKTLSVPLPRIELRNIGGKRGAYPGAIATQVLGPLVNQVIQAATRAGIGQQPGEGAAEMKKALEEKLAAPGKEAAKSAE